MAGWRSRLAKLTARFLGPGSSNDEKNLLRHSHGDRGLAERLIAREMERNPGIDRATAAHYAMARILRER